MQRISLAMGVILGLGLAGCATPYQESGFLGGVSAMQVSSDTFVISGRGNGFTDSQTIQRYVMRKAAETTLSAGATYFVIVGAENQTRSGTYISGSADSFSTMPYVKPGQDVTIRILREPLPSPMPAGAYSARDVLQYVGG